MLQISDSIILLLYCMTAAARYPVSPAFIASLLLAVCMSAFLYVCERPYVRLAVSLSYSLLLFFVPQTMLLLPLALYSFPMPWETRAGRPVPATCFFAAPAVLCAAGFCLRVSLARDLFLFAFTATGCALSVLLRTKAAAYGELSRKYRKTRDDDTEAALLLKERNRSLLKKQNAEIYAATLRERNRIAREIHDNVGHLLTRSILMVGALKAVNTEDAAQKPLALLEETLGSAMDSIRESVHGLHESTVDLAASLQSLTDGFLFCPVALQYDMSPDLPADIKYCFIAVTKEALANIARHSSASAASVTALEHPAFYQLSIQDNGTTASSADFAPQMDLDAARPGKDDFARIGDNAFAHAAISGARGIGLANIETRVSMLGGTLRIYTENGFHIFVTIPKRGDSYADRDH